MEIGQVGARKRMILRPMFSYFGAKWSLSKYLPPPRAGALIVEPFAGSAGYSLRYGAGRPVLLVDLDPLIVSVWDYLINAEPDQILELPILKQGESVDDYDLTPPERALIGFWLNKGATQPRKRASAWAVDYSDQFWGEKSKKRIASQVLHIKRWEVKQADYTAANVGAATYHIDPPYETAGVHYRHGSKKIDYSKLALWCRSLGGNVHVCEAEGAAWLPFKPFRKTKAMTKGKGRFSADVLWRNSPPAQGSLFNRLGRGSI